MRRGVQNKCGLAIYILLGFIALIGIFQTGMFAVLKKWNLILLQCFKNIVAFAGESLWHRLVFCIVCIIFLLLLLTVCQRVYKYIRRLMWRIPETFEDLPLDFSKNPQKYDHQLLTIQGRVVRIFSDTIVEKFKRLLIDKYRTWQKNNDYKGRYQHLRFLITSPCLKTQEYILVEYNLSYRHKDKTFNPKMIQVGTILEIKGEYIHHIDSVSFRFFNKRQSHFYGKLHKVHVPYGYIKVIY